MTDEPRDGAEESPQTEPFSAPHPGSSAMPRWGTGELIAPPRFTWRNWFAMLGPGLVLGGAAIGGGEWLLGPRVTAVYGGALLWLGTLSILFQVVYNIEISRYTLYCGEPIFSGKFRTLPGPRFWLVAYLLFDFGALFPYLAANAATPVATLIKGGVVPNPDVVTSDFWLMKGLALGIFVLALVPLLFGGKIYNTLKVVMSVKIFVVLGFLTLTALLYSSPATWLEITTGFFKFGSVPVERTEDLNGNGKLDDGEDWDGDGRLDAEIEPRLPPIQTVVNSNQTDKWPDLNNDGKPDPPLDSNGDGTLDTWGDLNGDGKPETLVLNEETGQPSAWPDVIIIPETGETDGRPDTFIDLNHDGYRDGANVDNVFVALFQGRPLSGDLDFALIAFITGLAAIAGSGGLSNTTVSNYTRDQGWGMGHHIGAIPSVIGGHDIQLSHVGCVFDPSGEALSRWRRWYRHVVRDQVAVWMPACFIGLALPAMLSVEFLRRGFEADDWTAAAMTADKVHDRVSDVSGPLTGDFFWFMILFCGFLVLAPSMAASADGIIRRWVDVFWTSSSRLRKMEPRHIKKVYFRVLLGYAAFGLIMLSMKPASLIKYATMIFNIAIGFSCWHALALNMILLPKPLRPGWFIRIVMVLAGLFFTSLGIIAVLQTVGLL